MENLQLVLFVLGAIAIVAVLVHGFWSIRKQQPKSLKESPMTGFYKDQDASRDHQGFDADGIGQVRIRKGSPISDDDRGEDEIDFAPKEPTLTSEGQVDSPVREDEDVAEAGDDFSLSDQPKQKASRQRQEPVLSAEVHQQEEINQMELGLGQETAPNQSSLFEATEPALSPEPSIEVPEPVSESVPEPKVVAQEPETLPEPQDVLVLHVVASEGEELSGAELLPSLLSLNFKFGDMSIFHRHEDNAGTGKTLFSLANMVKPGVFNLDDMEQFTTEGVVLFMTLPCHGEPLMNFSIMLNSAHQLADDLGGQLLDGGRVAWCENTKLNYLQRIRTQNS
ncbi:cell division protein ZipA [Shewanella canadensis]|uniref:Cell division protein ZipA n=1 Tax=Shewanella canadensis TaxID=271096 RepID=A0A3S0J4N4_9GAMM|nr:cell division protein ZipA [Shewanella canadensis]RTR37888.1 cell division protein ZipA [Shewanella canadensis]